MGMSADGLKVDLRDGILVLKLANPPLNDLTPDLRAALFSQVQSPPAGCRGIVLGAEGPHFSGLLPVEDAGGSPTLADLCRAVERSVVPIVAVLHGVVTGPGAELALAARARLADPSLRLTFADVTLGLCPQGGTTRRLPGLIGATAALRLLLDGKAVPASEALVLGLVDGITETAPLEAAARLAEALAVGDLLPRPAPDAAAWQAAVAEARKAGIGRSPAHARIVDCVEAALLLPSDSADDFESVARSDLEATLEAVGLRAAVRAERRALALPPVLGRLRPLSVDRVGLLGGAADLARIAVAALSRELAVTWVFPDAGSRKAGLAAVEAAIADGERTGTLAPDRAGRMRDRLTGGEDPAAVADVPLLIGDQHLVGRPTNDQLPGAARLVLAGAEGEMGLALSPAGRVCELTLPPETLPLARATALSGLRRIGLAPVLMGGRPVAGARMADAGRTAVAWMVARGVPHRMVASALDAFGLRLPDPVSMEAPRVARAMSAVEILHRWLAALANEGARLVEEGIARRPSDLDHLMVAGQQFPRWQGGPMHQADRRGLMVLRHDLRTWGGEAALWRTAPLIDRLIGEGRGFAALDA
jgi:3-hydroxyacyl-CoA dehydrogenase